VVFRNSWHINEAESWTYNGVAIELVNSFKYLGVLLYYNVTQKQVAEQGRKAMFLLMREIGHHDFNRGIEERRKQLCPVMKRAKMDESNTRLVREKLFINGSLYNAGSDQRENHSKHYVSSSRRDINREYKQYDSTNTRYYGRGGSLHRDAGPQSTARGFYYDRSQRDTNTWETRPQASDIFTRNRFTGMNDGDEMESDKTPAHSSYNGRKNKALSPLHDILMKRAREGSLDNGEEPFIHGATAHVTSDQVHAQASTGAANGTSTGIDAARASPDREHNRGSSDRHSLNRQEENVTGK
jgi:hypothetical protein